MGQPSLIAKLGIDEADFTRGLNASEAGLAQSQEKVKLLAGELALLEQRMASGKTDEMVQQHTKLQNSLRATKDEATAAARQLSALNAIKPAAAPVADDSARYEAHLRKQDEVARSQRANEAAANARLPMPMAARPSAIVNVVERTAEGAAVGAAGAGISRMGKMELGHVARSLAGSAAAGVPIGRSLEMEAPRLLSALGPAVLSAVGGFGGLLAVLAPLTAAVGMAAVGFTVYNANRAANKMRNARDLTGNVFNRGGDTVSEVNKELEDAEKQETAMRKARHSKSNHLANSDGGGLHDQDIEEMRRRKVGIRDRRDDAMERDAGFARREFDGDQGVEADKLRVDLEEKIRQIRVSGARDGNRLIEIAKQEHDLALDTLARKQAGQAIELAGEQQLLSVRAYGKNVETENATVRVRAAQAALKNGPSAGPEHDANANKLTAALVDKEQAKRNEANRATAIAMEERIVAIKRGGLNVDVQIAQGRLKAAQAVLDANPAQSGVEFDELKEKRDAAQFEVEAAQKATREKSNQAELETRIANLRGSSDQVRKATLDAERANIDRKLVSTDTNADDVPGLKADRARNQQQQDEFAKQQKLRAIDTAEKEDKAHSGRGFSDELDLLKKELDHTGDRRAWNQTENGNDASFNADLDTHVTELTRAISDLTFAENSRLTALQNEGKKITKTGYVPTQADKNQEIEEKYDKQIGDERHGKNDPAVIAQLESNREAEKHVAAVDEAAMTPAEREAREKKNNTRGFRDAQVYNRDQRHAEAEAANDTSQAAWDKRFHPGFEADDVHALPNSEYQAPIPTTLPNRMPEIQAGAQNAGKGDVAGQVDNAGIIGAINNPTWASKLSFQNKA